MAYFCPHSQGHGRASQLCATHNYVTRLCVPWGTLQFPSQIRPRQNTRACLVAV
ncbi:hypothetical protein F383_28870 [Gossypium arboreum]|uniref:Uncharacterized protein n=1 Tax=Gossypium arboreum TaxID=29729 RepID=A0A0B0MX20_GOSAR|nr:hypothetical protein F383_28870 [Gossypium arboreum]